MTAPRHPVGGLSAATCRPARRRRVPACAAVMLSVALLAGAAPVHAVAVPPAVQAQLPQLSRIGGGELRWLGFKLYDAALWASEPGEAATAGEHLLSIRYARAVSAERLVSLSLDEMRRLELADEPTLARWGEALAAVLPSVAAGDTLAGLHRPRQGAAFWHQGRPTGELLDPDLAHAFFAIWLDPRTREPRLRAQLLGLADTAR